MAREPITEKTEAEMIADKFFDWLATEQMGDRSNYAFYICMRAAAAKLEKAQGAEVVKGVCKEILDGIEGRETVTKSRKQFLN